MTQLYAKRAHSQGRVGPCGMLVILMLLKYIAAELGTWTSLRALQVM